MSKTIFPDGINGLPLGGAEGQVLSKVSGDDNDTAWVDSQGAYAHMLKRVDTGEAEVPRNRAGYIARTEAATVGSRAYSIDNTLVDGDTIDLYDMSRNPVGTFVVSEARPQSFVMAALAWTGSFQLYWVCKENTYVAANQYGGGYGRVRSFFVGRSLMQRNWAQVYFSDGNFYKPLGGYLKYSFHRSDMNLGTTEVVNSYHHEIYASGENIGFIIAENSGSAYVVAESPYSVCDRARLDYSCDRITDSVIPKMTSNTAPSGIASASSELGGWSAAWTAMRGVPGNWLASGGATQWIQYQFPIARVIKGIGLVPWSGDEWPNRVLQAWNVQASNDGSNWTTLYTQPSETGLEWQRFDLRKFTWANSTAYTHWRLTITANGSMQCGLNLFELYE